MEITNKINRITKTEPKLGKFYCHGCDGNHISKGGKCEVCGCRDKSKRRKK